MADSKTVPAVASKSDKFNNSVNKAINPGNAPASAMQPIGDAAAMFSKWTVEDMSAMASQGNYEFAPQLMTIAVGTKVEGILEGEGPGNDFENDGEVRHVKSWLLRSASGNIRVSILSSKQLDTKLPPFIGSYVVIARTDDIKLAGGHKCGNYYVGGPKRADGMERSWALPVAIEAAPAQAALPAGDVIDVTVASAAGSNGATAQA